MAQNIDYHSKREEWGHTEEILDQIQGVMEAGDWGGSSS